MIEEGKTITLRSWAGKMKEYHFQPCRQKNGERLPFVKPVRYDAMGNAEMILSQDELNSPERDYFIAEDEDIVVVDGTTFNLEDPMQRNRWLAIKNSDLIVPTRDAKDEHGDLRIDGSKTRYGIAELWVDVPGQESERSVSRMKKINKAWTFISNDSPNGYLMKCKILGKEMTNAPISDIQDYLYKRAEKNPDEIIELYTSSDMGMRILLVTAKEKYIVMKKDGLYMFGDTILGATDDTVISFLKLPQNKVILDQIKVETFPEYSVVSKPVEPVIEETVEIEEAPVVEPTTLPTPPPKKRK